MRRRTDLPHELNSPGERKGRSLIRGREWSLFERETQLRLRNLLNRRKMYRKEIGNHCGDRPIEKKKGGNEWKMVGEYCQLKFDSR